jgi:hypothetical protein
MKFALLFSLSLAVAAQAQAGIQVYPGTEDLIEGGRVEKLTVVSSPWQFDLRPPRGWYRQVDEGGQKIIFTAPSSKSAVIVQFTTNSPGALPPQDTLKAGALLAHPGAAIVQYAACPTGYHPGAMIDLVRVAAPKVVQRMRHAYVAVPYGEVEFILNASDDEFDNNRVIFMGMLRDFRVQQLKQKQT